MIRQLIALAAALLLAAASHAPIKASPACRALLIGCDIFLTHENTYPSAQMNVERMDRMLRQDLRGYESITRLDQGVADEADLTDAIGRAFAKATDRDVSLLYICTHGLYDRVSLQPLLVLCDGEKEGSISARALQQALDRIPGRKILILDACNSGAFIGKGEIRDEACRCFTGPDYLVLTSSGAYEDSFLWHDRDTAGGSYFAQELCDGLRSGAYDTDRDGIVTLSEAHAGLLESYGASTARIYPQSSAETLYVYDPASADYSERPLGDIVLDNAVLTPEEDTLYFSFTIRRPVRVQYQIIYYRDGEWRFDSPQIIEDAENARGALLPGRKQRAVTLVSEDEADSGYILLQIVTKEGRNAMLAGSRLFSVQQDHGDPGLTVLCPDAFRPGDGEELPVFIGHDFPCSLSVSIMDGENRMIRRLAYKTPSRPMGEREDGSFFYWDGKDSKGAAVPPGEYTVQATCRIGDTTWTQISRTELAGSQTPVP